MTLHLWKLRLDARAVAALARTQRLLHRELDEGYLVHAALAAACGSRRPHPFVVERMLSPDPAGDPAIETILGHADEPFDPGRLDPAHAHLIVDGASKPIPAVPQGARVGFVVRATPVVRTRRPASPAEPLRPRGQSREVDAFLAACARVGDAVPVDRAQVYRDWLQGQLASHGAELDDFALRAFRRVRLLRKETSKEEQGRKRHVLERPDALMAGTLRVEDVDAFGALLARGVGRHRAFGFGMLLVRRGA